MSLEAFVRRSFRKEHGIIRPVSASTQYIWIDYPNGDWEIQLRPQSANSYKTLDGVIVYRYASCDCIALEDCRVDIFAVGGGGGGGGPTSGNYDASDPDQSNDWGGGGGGGGYTATLRNLQLNGGQRLYIDIGAGGESNRDGYYTEARNSYFNGVLIHAEGGKAGHPSSRNDGTPRKGGAGGSGGGGASYGNGTTSGAGGADGANGSDGGYTGGNASKRGLGGAGQGGTTRAFGEAGGKIYGCGGGGGCTILTNQGADGDPYAFGMLRVYRDGYRAGQLNIDQSTRNTGNGGHGGGPCAPGQRGSMGIIIIRNARG